jgi:hypothetical protein
MAYGLIFVGVYGVGLLALVTLIVLETELCPASLRKALDRPAPKSER